MEDNRNFTVTTKDGKEVELVIKNPGLKDREEAESIRIRAWNRAVNEKAPFAEKLGSVLREQGLWDDSKDEKLATLRTELAEIFDKLERGGIKLSEAKDAAIKARQIRNEMNLVTFDRVKYASTTVEGISSDKEFQYLVYAMVYYKNEPNKKYYKDFNDYLNRAGDIDSYLIMNKVSNILYGGNEENWTENKFLKEFKFVDEKLRLINSDGHLVDTKGRLINEYGDWIKYDENGKEIIIDEAGNPVEVQVDRKPFLDEEGNEIVKNEEKRRPK
jgi:hypothetical protein